MTSDGIAGEAQTGGPGFEVRFATPGDAVAVSEVHVETWRRAYRGLVPDQVLDSLSVEDRAARWRKGIEADPRMLQLAERRGCVVGWVASGPCRDEGERGSGEVFAIYVRCTEWGAGVGRALLGRAEGDLRERGFLRVKLWVLEGNTAARAFYGKCGYLPDGARKTVAFGRTTLIEIRYGRALSAT